MCSDPAAPRAPSPISGIISEKIQAQIQAQIHLEIQVKKSKIQPENLYKYIARGRWNDH